jgi:hypothetical protein
MACRMHVITSSLDGNNACLGRSTFRPVGTCLRTTSDELQIRSRLPESSSSIESIFAFRLGSGGALFAALQISACARQMRRRVFLWLHCAGSRRCEPLFLPSLPFALSTIQIDSKTSRPSLFFLRNLGGFTGQYPDFRRCIATIDWSGIDPCKDLVWSTIEHRSLYNWSAQLIILYCAACNI